MNMKIERLRIESFKRFRKPLEIDGFTDGLNLFAAPNESGKSTIAEAIRAAFLERHRSGSVEHLRPWGEGSSSPTVDIDFSLAGQRCRLTKVFLSRKRCDLSIDGRNFTGAEAEDHLAGLLGFRFASRGASAAADMGVPGLLWIQQGSSHQITDAVNHAGDHLRQALGASIGDLTATAGDAVLAEVETQRHALLHATTGAPKGDYAAAIKKRDELAASVTTVRRQIADYRESVDRLATLRAEHTRQETAKPWEAAGRSLQQAKDRLELASGLETRKTEAERALRQVSSQRDALRQKLAGFEQDETARDTRRAALTRAEQAAEAARNAVSAREARHAEAVRIDRETRLRQTRVRSAVARAAQSRELASADDTLRRAQQALAGAQLAQQTLGERQLQAETQRIDEAAVRKLRKSAETARDAATRLEVAATTVDFALPAGTSLLMDGKPVGGTASRTVLARTRIDIPGLGHITITPGGAGIETLVAEHERRLDEFNAALRALNVTGVSEAEDRLQRFARLNAEVDAARKVLAAHAPLGMEQLLAEVSTATGRQAAARQSLAGEPVGTDTAGDLPGLPDADRAAEQSRAALEASTESLQTERLAAGKAEAVQDNARIEWQASADRLADPAWSQAREATRADLLETTASEAAASSALDGLQRQIAEAQLDLLRQDVERFDASVRQTRAAHDSRATDIVRLVTTLETTGALGLEETAAEQQAALEQASRRVEELARRARALDHLLGLLRGKRAELARRLRAPLQRYLNHYLQILFPGASVDIADNLVPAAINRVGANGAESGAFEDLSMGAREQMGIVARLAYADLMAEAGRPTLVMLDDALVHSDEDRLGRMKRVLYDAAKRHQLLVFTCHPEAWSDMGVAVRSIG